MDDSLIPIVLAILAAIIGAVTQGKKKALGPQVPQESQPDESPIPDAEVILKKILREMVPQPVAEPVKEPEPVSKPLSGDLSVPDELKRQRDLMMSMEGIRTIMADPAFEQDEIHDDIASSEIGDAESDRSDKPFEIAGVGAWDLRKAVIMSEILNRKAAI